MMIDPLNLIRLGAYCQRYFDMQPDFEIVELPSGYPPMFVIPIQRPFTYDSANLGNGFSSDCVTLEKVVFTDNHEYVYAGYSKATNKLIIKDGSHDTECNHR